MEKWSKNSMKTIFHRFMDLSALLLVLSDRVLQVTRFQRPCLRSSPTQPSLKRRSCRFANPRPRRQFPRHQEATTDGYQDDFADPSSGWPKEEFDNYFIGYHEPDYYHVDVRSPNDKELVPVPDKASYGDVTVEATVFTDPNNTAATGDFLYGLAFHRSGDQYYAFTISPRSQKWAVLKSSPNQLEVLKEGSDDSIQGLKAADNIRVDVQGSTFFLHINDRLVDQVSDSDYAEGEVGLYVQTQDIPRAHIHFDSVTIREVEAPQLVCSVTSIAMRVR
jgi:hypothetical protein